MNGNKLKFWTRRLREEDHDALKELGIVLQGAHCTYLACTGKGIIGYIQGDLEVPQLQVKDFYVLPSFRRLGVGKKLLKDIEQYLHQQGAKETVLCCPCDEEIGKGFSFEKKEALVRDIVINRLPGYYDENGMLLRWPSKREEQDEVLQRFYGYFDAGRLYTEQEVNQVIRNHAVYDDYALIRRELYDGYYLSRTKDCLQYWKEEKEE